MSNGSHKQREVVEERDRKVSLIAPKYFLVGGRTVQGEVRGKVKVKQRLEER